MADPIPCQNCGAVLLEGVSDRGVKPVDAEAEIPFRRTTDYVVCSGCFATYSVRDIQRMGAGDPLGEDDLIEHLERLAERADRSSPG